MIRQSTLGKWKSILMAEKEEVLGMIFEAYNEQKAMRAARKHAEKRFNEGIEQEKKRSVLRYSQLGLPAEQIAKGSDLQLKKFGKFCRKKWLTEKGSQILSGSFFMIFPKFPTKF